VSGSPIAASVLVSGSVCDRLSFGRTTPTPREAPVLSAANVAADGAAQPSADVGGNNASACRLPLYGRTTDSQPAAVRLANSPSVFCISGAVT
jgi:hypothetical protein